MVSPIGALPEFIIGDSEDDRVFVIHPNEPLIVFEVMPEGLCNERLVARKVIGDAAASELASLARKAAEFYQREIERGEEF